MSSALKPAKEIIKTANHSILFEQGTDSEEDKHYEENFLHGDRDHGRGATRSRTLMCGYLSFSMATANHRETPGKMRPRFFISSLRMTLVLMVVW